MASSPRPTPTVPAAATNSRGGSFARIRGLDGLRAIACALVVVYHLLPGTAVVGYTGVDVFFVLSGFLITGLLLAEFEKSGRIRFGAFWARRMRRLVPAVAVATLVTAALAFLVGGDAKVQLGRQVAGALTATYNWVMIAAGGTYFNQQSPHLLTNMWSLSVEQQFYLFWPLLVLGALVIARKRRRFAAILAATIAVLSIGLNILLGLTSPDRAYMGTDTHLWGLMFGALIAFLVPGLSGTEPARPHARHGFAVAGWLGLAGVIALGGFVTADFDWQPWTMVLASALTVLIVRALLPDVASPIARGLTWLLETPPLKWIGERSYGIYLWHWPLSVLLAYLAPQLDIRISAILIATASVLAAALSYSFIETPIRRQGFAGWGKGYVDRMRRGPVPGLVLRVIAPIAVLTLAALAITTGTAKTSAQLAVERGSADHRAAQALPTASPLGTPTAPAPPSSAPPSSAPASPTTAPATAPTQSTPAGSTAPDAPPTQDAPDQSHSPAAPPHSDPFSDWKDVTIIGDSVTEASADALQEQMPGITVDAEVSRSVLVAPDLIAQHAAQGTLGHYVVISLATNSEIDDGNVTDLLNAIGSTRHLVLVTAFGPARASWIPKSNAEIAKAAQQYPDRIRVADWYSAIKDHTDLLADDDIHPGLSGGKIYAEQVEHALRSYR